MLPCIEEQRAETAEGAVAIERMFGYAAWPTVEVDDSFFDLVERGVYYFDLWPAPCE